MKYLMAINKQATKKMVREKEASLEMDAEYMSTLNLMKSFLLKKKIIKVLHIALLMLVHYLQQAFKAL